MYQLILTVLLSYSLPANAEVKFENNFSWGESEKLLAPAAPLETFGEVKSVQKDEALGSWGYRYPANLAEVKSMFGIPEIQKGLEGYGRIHPNGTTEGVSVKRDKNGRIVDISYILKEPGQGQRTSNWNYKNRSYTECVAMTNDSGSMNKCRTLDQTLCNRYPTVWSSGFEEQEQKRIAPIHYYGVSRLSLYMSNTARRSNHIFIPRRRPTAQCLELARRMPIPVKTQSPIMYAQPAIPVQSMPQAQSSVK